MQIHPIIKVGGIKVSFPFKLLNIKVGRIEVSFPLELLMENLNTCIISGIKVSFPFKLLNIVEY